jgi:hypothetical protein
VVDHQHQRQKQQDEFRRIEKHDPPLTEIEGGTRITPAIRAYALFFSYLGRMMARPPK